ncbi:hypothetical protein GQ53DRAFT_370778 [Thozetella sp. PMI_491]|nr:hypothetical protein GQ53DRAFT_370778 [Thozetella sp. PMI_491]
MMPICYPPRPPLRSPLAPSPLLASLNSGCVPNRTRRRESPLQFRLHAPLAPTKRGKSHLTKGDPKRKHRPAPICGQPISKLRLRCSYPKETAVLSYLRSYLGRLNALLHGPRNGPFGIEVAILRYLQVGTAAAWGLVVHAMVDLEVRMVAAPKRPTQGNKKLQPGEISSLMYWVSFPRKPRRHLPPRRHQGRGHATPNGAGPRE